jgi:hypothetical protein
MSTRETEIQAQLETLYAQLEAFEEPFPDDAPFEYEIEEVEAWEKLRKQIRALEHELSEITKAEVTSGEDTSFQKDVTHYIDLTDKVLKNNRLAIAFGKAWKRRN